MAAWTSRDAENLAHYKDMLTLWRECEKAITANQSYTVGEKTFTKVNAEHVRKYIKDYENKIEQLENAKASGRRPRKGPVVRRVSFVHD